MITRNKALCEDEELQHGTVSMVILTIVSTQYNTDSFIYG